jgi:hypothetical protein
MHPHEAATLVRIISSDLKNGQALPPNASFSEWAARRNRYEAGRGRNAR